MVDPGSDNTNLWLAHNSVNTSQIRYLKAKKVIRLYDILITNML